MAGMVQGAPIGRSVDGRIRFQIVNGNPQPGQTGLQDAVDHCFRQKCAVGQQLHFCSGFCRHADHLQNVLTRVAEVIQHHTGNLPSLHSGSTDCNICYDRGVAGCCFGGYEGKGAHTRQERIEINSLPVGMKILMHFMLEYFD